MAGARKAPSALALYERTPNRALAALSDETKAQWQRKYCTNEGMAPRVWALLVTTEKEMRKLNLPRTIHALWVLLSDRAGASDDADLKAAAALAGTGLGLAMLDPPKPPKPAEDATPDA